MKTEEGNKLIAGFDGWTEYCDINNCNRGRIVMEKTGNKSMFLDAMEYHSSWDWLMPVVEKIENKGYASTIEQMFTTYEHRVFFNDSKTMLEVASGARDDSKIKAVYEAVIDFIQWHNKSSKPCKSGETKQEEQK